MATTEELDKLAQKCGGRFKLTVLIQKRLREIVRGGAKLVESDDRNLINIVIREIQEGKVNFEEYALEDIEKGEKKAKKKE